jgi:predicted amidohydrolase YtcJ
MERELGSIAVGKLAHFTVLSEDPYAVDPERLNRIPVLGTVFAGRWFVASR